MAKLTILASLFLALLAFNEATTITTTVTTTTIDDEKTTGKSQKCQQQVEGRQFRHCQKLMMQKTGKVFLNMVTKSNTKEEIEQDMQQCCQQLQSINSECVCDAVEEMMMQMQPGGVQQGKQMEMEMMMKAANLPVMCRIRQQPCPMF